jgi:hypothetical protein
MQTVSMQLYLLFFLGYDLDEFLPGHLALSRTRQLYEVEVFKEPFMQVPWQCLQKGMVADNGQCAGESQCLLGFAKGKRDYC